MNTFTEGKGVGPYELIQMIFLVFAGVWSIVAGAPPSLDDVLNPDGFMVAWCWLLATGSTLSLAGLLWRGKRITAYTTEQVGQALVFLVSAVYVVALLNLGNHHASFIAAAYVGGISLSCIIRAFKLERYKNELFYIQHIIDGIPGVD